MPNLRDEIEKLKIGSLCNHRIAAINEVLALFDKLDAARCINCSTCSSSLRPLYCPDCITRGYKKPFPPPPDARAVRPARDALWTQLAPGMSKDYGFAQMSTEAVVGRAVVEAIDALAERLGDGRAK